MSPILILIGLKFALEIGQILIVIFFYQMNHGLFKFTWKAKVKNIYRDEI